MIDISEFNGYKTVFHFFEEVSKIPRGSKNTSHIADYLVRFAKERGLDFSRDEYDNVVIRKPATKGKEGHSCVVFQGHTDIVAEKAADCEKDLEKEGLDIYRDGDFIKARGTTLGADDGVALAYALAVLDGAVESHPDFEAVFTSDEEIGLLGAARIDPSLIRGRLMINIDSDEEGVFTVGCAGGMQVCVSLNAERESCPGQRYKLTVWGLTGGHSGTEIHKGRENATHILAEVLKQLPSVRLCELSGGTKDNAIPRSAECIFTCSEDVTPVACQVFEALRVKYSERESRISFNICKAEREVMPLTEECSARAIELLYEMPTGVVKMSSILDGEAETSLNLGITRLTEDELCMTLYLRSSVNGGTDGLYEEIRRISKRFCADADAVSSYPAWEYNPKSKLCDAMAALYRKMYGEEPSVKTIHAGLECGILSTKLEGLECVSIGPDNFGLHTTEERLSIPSFVRVWEFVSEFLKTI